MLAMAWSPFRTPNYSSESPECVQLQGLMALALPSPICILHQGTQDIMQVWRLGSQELHRSSKHGLPRWCLPIPKEQESKKAPFSQRDILAAVTVPPHSSISEM